MSNEIRASRRNFVKTAVVAGVSLAAVNAAPALAVPTPKPQKWDYEADVIIVGGGAAGLAAACEAAAGGLTALVLEKEPIVGGSSIMCGGQLSFAGTPDQKAKGIEDSPELFTKDLLEVGQHVNNPELIKAFMDLNLDTYNWLKGLGISIDDPRVSSGMSVPRAHQVSPTQLITVLNKTATGKGVRVMTGCAAQRLVYDDAAKKICGLTAKFRNKEISFQAKKGLLLAAGGYSRNPTLLGQYTPLMRNAKVIAGLGTQGDGIKMALAYGADFIDTPYVKATYGLTMKPSTFIDDFMQYHYRGAVIVNKFGKRIVNESISYKLVGDAALAQPDGCGFQVFDSAIRAAEYEVVHFDTPEKIKKFEDRPGVIFKADTLKEVAKLAGIDPDVLEQTVANYNGYVEKGQDPEFGRTTLAGNYGKPVKIEKAPFYVMPSTAAVIATYCGLRITPKAEVVDVFGEVIPGVYAAGEMTGGFHGAAYMTGTAFCKAIVFGRIAVRNIAKA
ncbi:MAG: flavocytochrome c [Deltaproteobacteria bacterium]|jgi:fumarate reductase flavoprotein subunit|nr:flavocytochrome c [Deltaproteobacteria bacterium]